MSQTLPGLADLLGQAVSQTLADTPSVTTPYCPGCQPERDEPLLEVRYCEPHAPTREGTADAQVQGLAYLSGTAEAGGDDNRAWCALFHRRAS